MMLYLTLLLFLLPTIHAYSLFNFNNDKPSNDIQLQDNVVVDQPVNKQATPKTAPKATAKMNNDKDYGSNHSLLPPTESTLSTGLFHTCAITYRAGVDQDTCGAKPCGPVKCWGHDERGQSTPPPGVMFQQISAGGFFTCGVKADGRVVCWGDIDHPPQSFEALSSEEQAKVKRARRLQQEEDRKKGVKNSSRSRRQQSLHGNDYYLQVSSGNKHACAITKDYDVHCWGRNDYGESNPPEGKFVHLSAGHSFTCGILSNGEAKCWGKNNMGQSTPPSYPESIFEQVSASIGGDHACGVLKQDGDVQCWGNNGRSQSENQAGNFTQVSAGIRTSCAIRVDEKTVGDDSNDDSISTTIHCWGSRANTLLHHFEPDQVTPSNDKHNQISLGQDHACATTVKNGSDQTSLECWWMAGSNFDAHKVPIGISVM